MGTALVDELARREVIDAEHAHLASHSEVFIVVRNRDSKEFLTLAFVRARVENSLCIDFAQVPVGDSTLLANGQELIVVKG